MPGGATTERKPEAAPGGRDEGWARIDWATVGGEWGAVFAGSPDLVPGGCALVPCSFSLLIQAYQIGLNLSRGFVYMGIILGMVCTAVGIDVAIILIGNSLK